MPRAIYKAQLLIGAESVPVKLYSAIQDRRIHFRLLHASDHVPVRQHMVHPETEEEVPADQIRRGVESPRGIVVLDEDELAELEPKPTREIEVLRFVPPARLDHQWYVRAYWLGPDGSDTELAAFTRALALSNKEGIVRWVMRGKEYHGALAVQGDHLVLIALRDAAEIIDAAQLPAPAGREPSAQEKKMARQLVKMLEGPFVLEDLKDEYRERVLELVGRKAKGRAVELPRARTKRETAALVDALEASLERVKEGKVA